MITNSSAFFVNAFAKTGYPAIGLLEFLGPLVWLIGFRIEYSSDQQLKKFLEKEKIRKE